MKYNMVDTVVFDRFKGFWPSTSAWPSEPALAVALCMPSVSEGGVRAARGGRVSGLQALYNAGCIDAQAFNDAVWANFQLAYNASVGRVSTPSSKTNHRRWLSQAGLITTLDSKTARHTFLTDAGLAEVKQMGGPELAKLAKAFTRAAYDAALKRSEREAKRVAKRMAEAISDQLGQLEQLDSTLEQIERAITEPVHAIEVSSDEGDVQAAIDAAA